MEWYLNQHLKRVCSYDFVVCSDFMPSFKADSALSVHLRGKVWFLWLVTQLLKIFILPNTKASHPGGASHIKQFVWCPETNSGEREYILNLISPFPSEFNQVSLKFYPLPHQTSLIDHKNSIFINFNLIWNKIPWKCLHSSSNCALALKFLPDIVPTA